MKLTNSGLREGSKSASARGSDILGAAPNAARRRITEQSNGRFAWELSMLLLMGWNIWSIPFRLAFTHNFSFTRGWVTYIALDYVVDAVRGFTPDGKILIHPSCGAANGIGGVIEFFLFDLILRIRFFERHKSFSYVNSEHVFVQDKVMDTHQLLWWFFEFLAMLPYAFIASTLGVEGGLIMYRLPRLLLLGRANMMLRVISSTLERKGILVNAGSQRVFGLWLFFATVGHCVACLWYGLARIELQYGWVDESAGDSTWSLNDCNGTNWQGPGGTKRLGIEWDPATNKSACQQLLGGSLTTIPFNVSIHAYVRSLYWALITMVTVGLGDIVPAPGSVYETLFTIVTMYVGVLITCTVIGNLTNLVANLDAAEDESVPLPLPSPDIKTRFHSKMDNLNKYMAYRHLSQDLRERIRAYYQYMWSSLRGMDETKFLKDLPAPLRLQVAGLRSRDLVRRVNFLRRAREPLLNAICFNLEHIVVSPGDRVVVEGQSVHGVHFLGKGSAEMLKPGSKHVQQTMESKTGAHFGDTSLFFPETHKNTIRTTTYCEFFFLPREKFDKITAAHCSEEEVQAMKTSAEKAMKAKVKVNKFFGLEADIEVKKTWKRHFEPNTKFRHVWDLVCLAGILFQAFFIPARWAFYFDPNPTLTPWSVGFFFDVMFAVDIFFKCRLFAFLKEGQVIAIKSRIFKKYRKTPDFYIDILAALPLDTCALFLGIKALPLLRTNKLLRCWHLQYHLNKMQDFFGQMKINLSNAFYRLFRLFGAVLLFVHITGCIFLLMAKITQNRYKEECDEMREAARINNTVFVWTDCRDDWMSYDDPYMDLERPLLMPGGRVGKTTYIELDADKLTWQWVRAVYFVLVDMTTVGYGDVTPRNTMETTYVLVITLIGGLLYPAVVGAMAALISNLNALSAAFKNKVSTLNKYMELKGFPQDLRVRIIRYYDYLWSRQRGVDEDVILNDLPSPLRMEVQNFINGAIIRQIPFFVNMEPDLIRHLLSVLKPAVFLPNDYIIRAGEFGQEMYLLERGHTRVTSPDGLTTYAVLAPGDYFGEGCLLKAEKRTAAIRAVAYCDCFVLNRADFEAVSMDYPECRELLLKELEATLQKKKGANAKVMSNFKNHPKLSQTTSFEETAGKEVKVSSFRHPESRKRLYWDAVLLMVCVINFIAIPYRLAFPEGTSLEWFVPDVFLDLLYVIDIVLCYRFFGYLHEGKVFTDRDDISEQYTSSSRYRYHLVVSFPWEIFVAFALIVPTLEDKVIVLLALCRIPKLIRTIYMPMYYQSTKKLLEDSELFSMLFLELFFLLAYVMMVCHIMACIFFFIARYKDGRDFAECDEEFAAPPKSEDGSYTSWVEDYTSYLSNETVEFSSYIVRNLTHTSDSCPLGDLYNPKLPFGRGWTCGTNRAADCKWRGTWIQLQMDTGLLFVDGGSAPEQYLRALYWAVPTLVVVVIGDVIPVTNTGTMYVALGIFIGVTINATIIGNIANLISDLEGDIAAFNERKDQLEKALHLYELPRSVKERARRYYQYVFETQKGFDQTSIIQDLPATLRQEVSSFLKLSFVQNCPFFEFCDPALTKALAFSLTSRVYSPDDFIVHEGDLGREMYFIERGMVQMVAAKHGMRGGLQGSGNVLAEAISSQVSFNTRGSLAGLNMGPRDSVVDNAYTVLSTCSAGQFFGETALFFSERRSCSVRCLDYCELYVLHKSDLDELLRRYPFERDRMFQAVSELQAKNQLRNSKVKENFEKKIKEGTKLWKFMKTSSSVVRERLKYNPSFIPGARFVQKWNLANLVFLLYLLISIPYRTAFFVPGHEPFDQPTFPVAVLVWFVIDYMVDLYFWFDMYFQSRKFAFLDEGKLMNDPARIFKRYKKKLFVNVLANFPFDLFIVLHLILKGRTLESSDVTLMATLRIPHMLRLIELPRQLNNLQTTIADWRVRVSSPFLQVLRCLLMLFSLNHIFACGWFILHRINYDRPNTWAVVDGLASWNTTDGTHNIMNKNLGSVNSESPHISPHLFCYIRALYFVITTLSTVGYGDIRPYSPMETIYELVVVTSGACVFAAIIGSIAVLFSYSDSNGDVAFKAQVRKYKNYMNYRQLPSDLQRQILRHFTSLWDRQNGVVLTEILADLPVPMQLDIAFYVNRDVIRKVPGLRKCSKHVQKNIALALSPQVCSPGDYVYRSGDIGHEIYFILFGEVNVLVKGGKQVSATLAAGDLFGEASLSSVSGERKESVRAVTQCDLYYMHKSRLEDILADYPENSGIEVFAAMFKRQESNYEVEESVVEPAATKDGGRRQSMSGLRVRGAGVTKDEGLSPLEMFAQMQSKLDLRKSSPRRLSVGPVMAGLNLTTHDAAKVSLRRDSNNSKNGENSSVSLRRCKSLATFGITAFMTESERMLYDELAASSNEERNLVEAVAGAAEEEESAPVRKTSTGKPVLDQHSIERPGTASMESPVIRNDVGAASRPGRKAENKLLRRALGHEGANASAGGVGRAASVMDMSTRKKKAASSAVLPVADPSWLQGDAPTNILGGDDSGSPSVVTGKVKS